MAKRAPRKGEGRPTIYTKKLGLEICGRIALGESVLSICKDKHMPGHDAVYLWLLDEDKREFSDNYARARSAQAEKMFEEIVSIADDGSNDFMTVVRGKKSYNIEDKEVTNRSRLRVDTRKWYLSKVLPKKFGDKLDLTSDNKPIPLLHVLHQKDVPNNDSHTQDTGAAKKD